MDKILEFLDYLIITTQGGLRWDFIESQEPTNNEKAYYRILNPESKDDLITLSREKDNIFLKLRGKKLTINISSNIFFSVEDRLRALYDEVKLHRITSEHELKVMNEEFDRVILMLG